MVGKLEVICNGDPIKLYGGNYCRYDKSHCPYFNSNNVASFGDLDVENLGSKRKLYFYGCGLKQGFKFKSMNSNTSED